MPDKLNPTELRDLIRREVIAALERFEQSRGAATARTAPSITRILLLFMSPAAPSPDFLAQVQTLARPGGLKFSALFSYTFKRFHKPETILTSLPQGTDYLASHCEQQLLPEIECADMLIAPVLSANTAAKLAFGINDSVPLLALTNLLRRTKPVFIGQELDASIIQLEKQSPGLPAAMLHNLEGHLRKVKQMGAQFVAETRLAAEIDALLHPAVNETPERLARQRPAAPKRVFITVEDVWEARNAGKKEIFHSRSAVVTDEARDYARANGITLRSD